ncbi:MAG: hypothetical protein ACRCWM_02605 [Sarcina sp.]
MNKTENTSHISNLVYKIENWLSKGITEEVIKERVEKLKYEGEFPENLELAETLFDEKYSVGACAFVDINTGETIVGFAGTNSENNYFLGDLLADAKLGIGGGFNKQSPYMEKLNEFMEELHDKGYNVTKTIGYQGRIKYVI